MSKRAVNREAFTLGEHIIQPGEEHYIELPLPGLYTHSPVCMPVHVTHGRADGAKLFISAAIHGDEINGVEIIRRVITSPVLKRMRGTLIAVPVVNVYGFINKSRYLPDRRDLNRSFPGSENGSMASKLAHVFLQQIARRCQYGIDLHTAAIGRDNLPQIRGKVFDDAELLELAAAFDSPVILNAELREGSLRHALTQTSSTKVLLYEAGEALRFDEIAIRAGVRGILNIMRHLGMLSGQRHPRKQYIETAVAHSSRWVRAPQSGILRSIIPMGSKVEKGTIMGYVADPFGETEKPVIAPTAGMIIGKTTLPLVHEGEAIFHIARFDTLDSASRSLEDFHNELEPSEGDDHVIF